jgi:hypothetical protein
LSDGATLTLLLMMSSTRNSSLYNIQIALDAGVEVDNLNSNHIRQKNIFFITVN